MKSLIESLPASIARLEKLHGSENRFVKMLKEQLRASIATQGQSAQQVFMAQAQTFPVKSEQAQPDPMQGAADIIEKGLDEMFARYTARNEPKDAR